MTGTASADKSRSDSTSSVPRRVLGQHLRNLRQQAGLSVRAAASLMEWSEPKLWRIETGQIAMRVLDVQAMCDFYSAPPDLTQVLAGLARHTRAYGWWHSNDEPSSGNFSIYAMLQESASNVLGYAPGQVPDLLRTEDYARAVMTSRQAAGGDADHLVRECLARQIIVFRAKEPLWVTIILSEAMLRCPVGGASVMAGQLRHLAEIATLPNVCLRVVPFSAGSHPGLATGTFTLLEFAPAGRTEPGSGIVHAPGLTGELYLDKPQEIRSYREAHAAILGCSLDETASRDLLSAASKELEQ